MTEFLVDRLPPNNVEAEQALLGSVMIDRSCIEKLETITPDDFYDFKHQHIFDAMKWLQYKETPIDLQTLTARLKATRSYSKVGGAGYLASLANQVPTASNAKHYAKLIAECSLRRKLIDKAFQIQQSAYDEKKDVEEVLEFADKEITGVMEVNSSKNGDERIPEMSELLNEFDEYYNSDEPEGMGLGLEAFDKELLAIPKGQVVTLQAPTGGKKSTVALNIAYALAKSGKKVLYINLENPRTMMIGKLMCIASGMDTYKVKRREFKDGEIPMALDMIGKTGLRLDSPSTVTIPQLERRIRMEQKKNGLDFVIIDHLYLIKSKTIDATARAGENMEGVMAIARKLNLPILALLQLNRFAQMNGKKPERTDARDSSVVENTAGLMLALQTKKPAEISLSPDEEQLDVYVVKNRYGIEGQVLNMKFNWRNLRIS